MERSLALRYVHVMIDEFQDASALQYEIARRLASIHGNLCAVGDPDQSIYGWRQADIRNFERLKGDFPDAREILLETNYRSTDNILGAASALMSRAEPTRGYERKTLRGVKVGGTSTTLAEFPDEDAEAAAAVGAATRIINRRGPGSVAICYRANSQSRALESACAEMGVPYRVLGGLKFYQRAEVKDVCAYLRLIAEPRRRRLIREGGECPKTWRRRGVGRKTAQRIPRGGCIRPTPPAADTDLLEVGRASEEGRQVPDRIRRTDGSSQNRIGVARSSPGARSSGRRLSRLAIWTTSPPPTTNAPGTEWRISRNLPPRLRGMSQRRARLTR